jgi:glycosyltransferase involved in cell wall biosynthesis
VPTPTDHRSNVEFAGRVSDDALAQRYATAPCVVAPAYQEDYGLTAIEAMAEGKPVVVCRDGGGLTELVDHEQTGLVVDPTPAAIADAVERLCTDPDLAAESRRERPPSEPKSSPGSELRSSSATASSGCCREDRRGRPLTRCRSPEAAPSARCGASRPPSTTSPTTKPR